MVKRLWGQKFFRFLCIGAGNTLLDFTLLNALTLGLKMPALLANVISASIGITISYFLNHTIVFRREEAHSLQKFTHFFVVTGLSILLIQTLVIWLVTTLLGDKEIGVNAVLASAHLRHISTEVINLNLAKACAVVAGLGWNFILYNLVVFKETKPVESE